MDSKEKISIALQASVFDPQHAADLAEELYDFVAHELAEKIRNTRLPSKTDGFYGPEVYAYVAGSDDAADSIDPEVDYVD